MCPNLQQPFTYLIVTVGWLPYSFEVILAISPVINCVGSFMLDDPACLFTGVRVAIGCHIHLKCLAICPFMNCFFLLDDLSVAPQLDYLCLVSYVGCVFQHDP